MDNNNNQPQTTNPQAQNQKCLSKTDPKKEESKVNVVISLYVLTLGWVLTYFDFFLNEFQGIHDSTLYALAQAMLFAGFLLTGKAYIDYQFLKLRK